MRTLDAMAKALAVKGGDASDMAVCVLRQKLTLLHSLLALAVGPDPVDREGLNNAIGNTLRLCGTAGYSIPHKPRPKQTKDALVGVVVYLLGSFSVGEPQYAAIASDVMDTLLGALETMCNGHNTNLLVVANGIK
jgi:hypothetical protein